jgi:hypothetical protein
MQDTTIDKKTEAETPSVTGQPIDIASSVGKWAHGHRDFFRSKTGDIAARNILGSAVAWVPTIASFAVTRAAWEKYEAFAAKHADALLTKIGKPFLSKEFPVGRNIGFIFSGWFTYRTTSRLYHRAYDRLFAAKDSEAAAQVVRETPHTLVKDLKEIVPGGLAEVTVGAFVLGATKAALIPAKNHIAVNKGQWAEARKGFVNDWLATGIAYSAFTEVCDHIYPVVTHGKDSAAYYRELQGKSPKTEVPPEQKKFGFFTNDGAGRMVFRTTGAVLFGFAAYFAGQRSVKAAIGVPTNIEHTVKGILTNYAKDYAAWIPFAAYTSLSQIYREKYDAVFDRLEKKEAGRTA